MKRMCLACAFAAAVITAVTAVVHGSEGSVAPVSAIDTVGMTVGDMERAVRFYTTILDFEQVSDVEVAGRPYELLEGVFGARMRVVRLRLGDELIELTEYLAPKGRPMPEDMRANDRLFQHVWHV